MIEGCYYLRSLWLMLYPVRLVSRWALLRPAIYILFEVNIVVALAFFAAFSMYAIVLGPAKLFIRSTDYMTITCLMSFVREGKATIRHGLTTKVSSRGQPRLTFWSTFCLDLRYQCYTGTHVKMMLAVMMPMLLLYVIGIPLTGFLLLRRNSDHVVDSVSISLVWR